MISRIKALWWFLTYRGPGKYDNIPYLNGHGEVVWPDGTKTPYEPYSTVGADQSTAPELQKILTASLDK